MKAITLWQPWASLVFSGWKNFETRSWATSYRGPLAIHAAARRPPIIDLGDFTELLYDEFGSHWAIDLPLGAVIGTVTLTDCQTVDAFDVDAPERLCGDWTPGRFAWRLEEQKLFAAPISAKGKQGFWEWRPNEVTA